MDNLFRKKALEQHTNRLHGDILLLPSIKHSLVIGALCLWVALTIAWLVLSTYARKETVTGWLEPPTGVIRIYPEDNGIITQVLVQEGERVAKDQPLMQVTDDKILSNGDHLNTQLLAEYANQRALINDQITRNQAMFQRNAQDLNQQLAAAKHQLTLLNQQLTTLNQRYKLIDSQVERLQALKTQGHASVSELENAVNQQLSLRTNLQELERNQIAQQNTIEKIQTEQKLQPDEQANTLNQLRSRLSDIDQQITRADSAQGHIIKAPQAGVVNNLQASAGQKIQSNNILLLTLLPNDEQLTAHLLIPVRSAGFLEPNQHLNIRYDAFPYQKFGLYEGRITSISKTILLPNELLHVPVQSNEPVYRVTAILNQPNVQAYGKDFLLKPGMTLTADIKLSDRTLFQWLLEPIFSLKGRL